MLQGVKWRKTTGEKWYGDGMNGCITPNTPKVKGEMKEKTEGKERIESAHIKKYSIH